MLKGEYMAEELEKWRYPRFFSDTIDENDRIIYMNDEDSKHIAQVLLSLIHISEPTRP